MPYQLKQVVESQHGGKAVLVAAEPVEEDLNGETVWEGGRRLALLRYVYFST